MAEPLKNRFGPSVVRQIAATIDEVTTAEDGFDREAFVADCLDGFEDLELTSRAQQIADTMARHLPADPDRSLRVLVESLGPAMDGGSEVGMSQFRYLPHVKFVAEHGQGHFQTAMELQYELTKRFTAEFSIRSYLVGQHRDATLDQLREWTADPSEHVRRLVSEGTRPRLPWAPRLPEFISDPTPVLALLELLRHDSSEYVRRSVANNLNDIAKDHPLVVVETCRRWWSTPDWSHVDDERRMIRHALRTLIKQGDPAALSVLGFGASSPARLAGASIEPSTVAIGDRLQIEVTVENPRDSGVETAAALVDLRVHFVKSNGSASPKVFRGGAVHLASGTTGTIRKTISLKQHSTRRHYPGTHVVEALINGQVVEIGAFELTI